MLKSTAETNPKAIRQGQNVSQMVSSNALGMLLNHFLALGLEDEILVMFCGTVWAATQWLMPDLANFMRGQR